LLEHGIHQGGFAVVNVGDYGDIANFFRHILSAAPLMKSLFFLFVSWSQNLPTIRIIFAEIH